MNYKLQMMNISKSFHAVQVLQKICLSVKEGELHALVGENGAGKSTLMKILMGIYKPDSGHILIDNKVCTITSATDALNTGISMIHQELNPVPDMDVSENIFLGRELILFSFLFIKIIDRKKMWIEAQKILHDMGISISAKEKMRNLTVAQIQLIEIVKAITLNSKIVIMDEPTSAITDAEAKILFKQIDLLKKTGVAIIYISHKMNEIFDLADSITVLRDGEFIVSDLCKNFTPQTLISAMVGRKITEVYPKKNTSKGEVLFEVKNLSLRNKVKNVSFCVHSGEVLGFAGLVGAGRSELVESIFGVRKKDSGEIFINGKLCSIIHPRDAIKNKMSLITEDRKMTGLNLKFTVQENISIVALKSLFPSGIISAPIEQKIAEENIKKLNIKTFSPSTIVASLSGGNQQKVVLAKWLLNYPEIIIFDEPTRGIDIGAKRDIYELITNLANQKKAIIVISSELPEIMGISDRILVMSEGKVQGELFSNEFSQEKIMEYAAMRRLG